MPMGHVIISFIGIAVIGTAALITRLLPMAWRTGMECSSKRKAEEKVKKAQMNKFFFWLLFWFHLASSYFKRIFIYLEQVELVH